MQHNESWQQRLEGLHSKDIAPQWRKEPAWKKVSAKLATPKRRVLPLWTAPLAAAAGVLCLLLLRSRSDQQEIHQTAQRRSPARSAVTLSVISDDRVPVTADTTAIATIGMEHDRPAPASIQKPRQFQPETDSTTGTLAGNNTSPVQAIATAGREPIIKREPETVYTLNEIMANVPESETPPRRYSGLFKGKQPADVPDEGQLRRRPGRIPDGYQTPDVPAIIIIN